MASFFLLVEREIKAEEIGHCPISTSSKKDGIGVPIPIQVDKLALKYLTLVHLRLRGR